MAIKNIKYKVKNGSNDYDIIYFETSAEQVVTSDASQFVSKTEKETWNSKAENVHSHSLATDSTDGFMSAADKVKLDSLSNIPAKEIEVIDNLNSTNVDSALSANQGRVLSENLNIITSLLEHFNSTMFNIAVCVKTEGSEFPDGEIIITATPQEAGEQEIVTTLSEQHNFIILSLNPGINYSISLNSKKGYDSSPLVVSGGTGSFAFKELVYTPRPIIYGFEIDQKELDDTSLGTNLPPYTVHYIYDAVGMQPITSNNGVIDLGDWGQTPLILGNKPCVVQDGVVQYYLNPNNYALKEDGTPANLDGTDGDVMAEFSKMYYKIERDQKSLAMPDNPDVDIIRFSISTEKIDDSWYCLAFNTADGVGENDKMYISTYHFAYKDGLAYSISNADIYSNTIDYNRNLASKGQNYQQLTAPKWNYLQLISTLVLKTPDASNTFGNLANYPTRTGGGDTRGQFYGKKSGEVFKFFHIENPWNRSQFIEGITHLMGTKTFAPYGSYFEYTGTGFDTTSILSKELIIRKLKYDQDTKLLYPDNKYYVFEDYGFNTRACYSAVTMSPNSQTGMPVGVGDSEGDIFTIRPYRNDLTLAGRITC